jgi:hypothetical protein
MFREKVTEGHGGRTERRRVAESLKFVVCSWVVYSLRGMKGFKSSRGLRGLMFEVGVVYRLGESFMVERGGHRVSQRENREAQSHREFEVCSSGRLGLQRRGGI